MEYKKVMLHTFLNPNIIQNIGLLHESLFYEISKQCFITTFHAQIL